ncbi:glycosyltransferase family 4 protein [Actinoplanes subtropicus]|uniref:glycosyltransferase family 4 protein n=1 Tax=Actinoplanes subtropicus TaxID=543632 RepID=UPI00068BD4B4|nr:glycosyltransferase family 4 protein [Actinoplanes subtropicus]
MSAPGAFARAWRGRHVVICNWRDSGHPAAGGAELYCERVAGELHRAGARVTYLTARAAGQARTETTPYGTVVRRGGTLTVYPHVLWWLLRHRRSVDGVIDSQNGIPFFTPLALRRRTPVVQLIHHVHQDQFEVHFPKPIARLGQFLENQASRWVYRDRTLAAVSPSARQEIRRRLSLRGPVLLAACGQEMPDQHRREPAARPRIVCVGRLVRQKRVDLLLHALPAVLRRIPDLEVHLVGSGDAVDDLVALADRLGLGDRVVFHGRVDPATRDALVASAWLTVSASMGEGWGLSIMEAAASGVPAVALNVPGLRDTIRHGETGWLVEVGEDLAGGLSAGIVEALLTLADTVERAAWSARCVAWASQFTWESTAAVLRSALSAERHRLANGRPEARQVNDAVTLVVLPADVAGRGNLAGLRGTDRVASGPDHVALLMYGTDEINAERALTALGFDVHDPRVTVRLARQRDLLGWQTVVRPLGDSARAGA